MTSRVLIGERTPGEFGIWTAPTGKDVFLDPDSELSFSMTRNYEQIALIGVAVGGVPIPFSYSSPPHVLLLGAIGSYMCRPYPSPVFGVGANGYVTVTSTNMIMSSAGTYVIFKRTF